LRKNFFKDDLVIFEGLSTPGAEIINNPKIGCLYRVVYANRSFEKGKLWLHITDPFLEYDSEKNAEVNENEVTLFSEHIKSLK
jgi:hypothetical protein